MRAASLATLAEYLLVFKGSLVCFAAASGVPGDFRRKISFGAGRLTLDVTREGAIAARTVAYRDVSAASPEGRRSASPTCRRAVATREQREHAHEA